MTLQKSMDISIKIDVIDFNDYSRRRLSILDAAISSGIRNFFVSNEPPGIKIQAGGTEEYVGHLYKKLVESYGKENVEQTEHVGNITTIENFMSFAIYETISRPL
jgi:hypothetical protein